jgi:hypothetical protein
MASIPTPQKKPQTIVLKYYTDEGGITTVTTIPPSDPTHPLKFQVGDRIEFISDQGPQVKVYVDLNTDAYEPSQFTPISGPVTVVKETGTSSKAQCWFEVKGKRIPPAGEVGYETLPGVDTWP